MVRHRLGRMMVLAVLVGTAVIGSTALAQAQVSVDIGIHLGSPPPLVPVPETPVMYAPSVNGNFFFYDGGYYVFRRGAWYMAPRHDGPWARRRPRLRPPAAPRRARALLPGPSSGVEALARGGSATLAAGLWTALGGSPRSR